MSAAQPRGQAEDACPKLGTRLRLLDRWELLSLITDLRQELGLTDRDVMVLRAHLSVLPHGPLDPEKLNVSFMRVAEILGRACGMDERRFRRGETRLEQAGLIRRRLSGNGRRFPERDRQGHIINAYGIDLAPLFERHAELQELRERLEERHLLLRSRKNSISARLQAALKAFLASDTNLPDWIEALRTQLRRAVRRKTTAHEELDDIETRILSLEHAVCALPPAPPQPETVTSTPVSPVKKAADGGQTVRHIESKLKKINKRKPTPFSQCTISESWAKTLTLKDLYPLAPKTEREAAEILFNFASFIRIAQPQVLRGLALVGWEGIIQLLDYMASKMDTIAQPEVYLRSMIKACEQGDSITRQRVVPCYSSRHQRMTPA
ncbi:helix-turn-helix domain-containing protein [Puniceibacterium sp. IMCC21224]|uniref:helix-turn-helix domain-containing protein n=1 Tax=Puniceibacterium sp. IMCC21224 TaxID=1618204 RepID=UPI00064DFA07|nr:helix-turn-helix domain-containing protein [Puniceibacterium sp. IMCC21224]